MLSFLRCTLVLRIAAFFTSPPSHWLPSGAEHRAQHCWSCDKKTEQRQRPGRYAPGSMGGGLMGTSECASAPANSSAACTARTRTRTHEQWNKCAERTTAILDRTRDPVPAAASPLRRSPGGSASGVSPNLFSARLCAGAAPAGVNNARCAWPPLAP